MLVARQDLQRLLRYDAQQGSFYLLKSGRMLVPDDEGYIIFFNQKKKYKLKANKVALQLGNSTVSDSILADKDKVVLHRNLDSDDYRLINLRIITKKQYNQLKEAHKNLSYCLKLQTHPTDAFSYVLTYREDNKDKQRIIQDVVVAKRMLLKLKLKYAKILSKWCLFDI